jgi:DNA-binding XRE family transcriptional regulator
MQAEMRLHFTEARQAIVDIKEGQEVISLSVPEGKARTVADAIKGMLTLAGHKVRRINSEGEEVIPASEVFSDANPAMMLRGLRGKEDITQQELAERLGITQTMVSDLESGKRPISLKMAKRIGEAFNVPYKLFV